MGTTSELLARRYLVVVLVGIFGLVKPVAGADTKEAKIKDLEARVASLEKELMQVKQLLSRQGANQTISKTKTSQGNTRTAESSAKSAPPSLVTLSVHSTAIPSVKGTNDKLGQVSNAFGVPDSPSAQILGTAPQRVVRPSTPMELISALINGVDKQGNLQTGLAIDWAPFQYYTLGHTQLDDYSDSTQSKPQSQIQKASGKVAEKLDWEAYIRRVLTRTQLSLATTKGTSDADKSIRLAVGAQITLMNENDPVSRALQSHQLVPKALQMEIPDIGFVRQLGVSFDQLGNRYKSWHYNSSWLVGAAQAWTSPDGTATKLRPDGYGVYSTYSYGFEGVDAIPIQGSQTIGGILQRNAQLLLRLSYRDHESVSSPGKAGQFLPEDTFETALRLRIGEPEFNGSLIGSVADRKLGKTGYKWGYSLAFALEKKIPNTTSWLTLSLGKEFDTPGGKDPVLILGGIKLGITASGPNGDGPTERQ